jgi:hypothetical protein
MQFYLTFPSIICTHHILNVICSLDLLPMCSLFPMTRTNKWCLPILLYVFLQFMSIIKLSIKSLCISGLHLPFMWSFQLSLKSTLCSKINMKWHAFSLAIFAQLKSKIGSIPLTFLNGKQQKTITHTISLHSSFNERTKLEQFFSLFQMARKKITITCTHTKF